MEFRATCIAALLSVMILGSAAFAVVDQNSRPAFIHLVETILVVCAEKAKDKDGKEQERK